MRERGPTTLERREIELIVRCVLSHPIMPLFIVVGKVNSLLFRITTFNR